MKSQMPTGALVAAALLISLAWVPGVRAEGERPSDPDTLTFYNGGQVTGGRKENLEFEDNRTLRLSDTELVGGAAYNRSGPPTTSQYNGWLAFPDSGDCTIATPWGCADESWSSPDDFTTYLGALSDNLYLNLNGTIPGGEFGDELTGLAAQMRFFGTGYSSGTNITSQLVVDDAYVCHLNQVHVPPVSVWSTFNQYAIQNLPSCLAGSTIGVDLQFNCSPCTGNIVLTTLNFLANYTTIESFRLGAELSVPSRSEYPVRAEWTCSEDEDNGPYYIGARNATATRWFGELCPSGAGDYNATMTSEDMIDGRVYFRIADNATDDPTGYLTGNVTLDRLVAILTADFQVSVANLGWLLYLAFMTVGILVAVWAFYLWRERE